MDWHLFFEAVSAIGAIAALVYARAAKKEVQGLKSLIVAQLNIGAVLGSIAGASGGQGGSGEGGGGGGGSTLGPGGQGGHSIHL